MGVQRDPGTLNNQMDVAATPDELFQLAKQVALDTEAMWGWAAGHTQSIDLTSGLFPETRIELRAHGTRLNPGT
ncbi:MAG TPA: hypothetical protein VHG72_19700 [Polyangia bacterium]|nr:hypothetical protein [Polyangia bacterium]